MALAWWGKPPLFEWLAVCYSCSAKVTVSGVPLFYVRLCRFVLVSVHGGMDMLYIGYALYRPSQCGGMLLLPLASVC